MRGDEHNWMQQTFSSRLAVILLFIFLVSPVILFAMFLIFYLFLFGEEGKTGRETSTGWLLHTSQQELNPQPSHSSYAFTGNQIGDLSLYEITPNEANWVRGHLLFNYKHLDLCVLHHRCSINILEMKEWIM